MPEGCDAVVMQEETEQTEAGVRFIAPVKAGQHIRRRGEDIAHGAVVFPAGTPLTVAELPVLGLTRHCRGRGGAQGTRRGLLNRR